MNSKAPHGDRPRRAFECVQQGGGTVQKYHKVKVSTTSSFLLPLPSDHADAPITRFLNVTFDHETGKRYGYVVTAVEVYL